MRKIRWMALAPVAALACVAALAFAQADHGAALNTLTPAEKAAGWKLLFDGHDTKGWRNFMKPGVDAGWVVKDGILICADPKHTDDIITVGKYADFDLSFEWRISKMGNSGVYYHVIEAGEHGYESGPEYQLLDNAHGEKPKEQAGSLFGLYPPSKDTTKPVGEFNLSRIVVNHGHVEHWMNGVKVAEYQLNSPDFKARVAGTKFANWPLFATADTGFISLQDHGDGVAFRNIKIKSLD
jgi:hypothetical protein